MDAGKRTINDIFNGNRILEIPFFQRAYVWENDQWERLLEDMEYVSETRKSYFLGSIILKQKSTETGETVGDKRTLIDGQQRLTTLSIFFKVLSLRLGDSHEFDRMFKLRDKVAIQHNHSDIDVYESIMNLNELKDLTKTDNITKAYSYFRNKLEVKKLDINIILSKILFVGIDLGENEDEQQIFDTINSLGVNLTTAELLKNHFFNRDEIEIYNEHWKNIFEKDNDTKEYWAREITTGRRKRTFIDLFFFSYLQIKIQDETLNVESKDKKNFSKVERLFESYKKFIKNYLQEDKTSILTEIKEYAMLFQKNFDYDIIASELTEKSGIERINAIIFGLETSTLIPYVLYVIKNVANDKDRNQLFDFIETYVMRRMVVKETTKNYNQLFTDQFINKKILSKGQFVKFLERQDEKVNFLPTNEELKVGFDESTLINKQSRGILYFIESKIRNRESQSTQLLGIDKYSLEHLMPKKWANHWGKLSSEEAKGKRDKKLKTLGNLAIITQKLNSAIRDADWTTKKNGKKGNKEGLERYSAGLETMNQFLACKKWNEQTIEKRANFLYEEAKRIWKI